MFKSQETKVKLGTKSRHSRIYFLGTSGRRAERMIRANGCTVNRQIDLYRTIKYRPIVGIYNFELSCKRFGYTPWSSRLLGARGRVSDINIPELRPVKVNGRVGGRAARRL